MKKFLLTLTLFVALVAGANAQKISRPTLESVPPTEAQLEMIRTAIGLHDAKRYKEAIETYKQVLDENPAATLALYELSLTHYVAKEPENVIKTALEGTQYRSKQLPLFYLMIANVLADQGKGDDAIKLYRNAIKILKKEKNMTDHLSAVHYNLAGQYIRQKAFTEARQELKTAVETYNASSNPHRLLSELFIETDYRIPALLAAGRFISLEYNTDRSTRAAHVITTLMRPAQKDEKTGNTTINLNFGAPTDEGEFAMYEMMLPMLGIVSDEADEEKKKMTDEERFADSFDTFISMLEEDKNLRKTFVGKNYVPFYADMKKAGYVPVFSHLVLYRSGNEKALAFLSKNDVKVKEFLEWAKAYQLKK